MNSKTVDNKIIAKKVILSTLKMENSLINVLKAQMRLIKKMMDKDDDYNEIKKTNASIRQILHAIHIIDDRIQKCLDILI
ncbi:MAG: hypothetical protein EWM47_04555 [Anaerolineaceae bacterium]|nr:MAG: hypothetical protein EWM47_04555 [Anaerolineaceae bacterium]